MPFVKYGGLRFLESSHIKDLLALLRILDNVYDELAWFRTLRLADGVGPATARRLLASLGVRPRADAGSTSADRLRQVLAQTPRSARAELGALAEALAGCGDEAHVEPREQIAQLRRALDPIVRRSYHRPDARLHDFDELEHLAAGYRSRGQLVAELVLDPPAGTGDLAGPPLLDEDYLVLSTVHSAKGGEWDAVHLLHAADGMFPSDLATGRPEEVEEERRLFYVAVTRARDHLHVYFPLRYYHRRSGLDDAHHYAQLTRFLPDAARDLFDSRHAGPASPEPAARARRRPRRCGRGGQPGVAGPLALTGRPAARRGQRRPQASSNSRMLPGCSTHRAMRPSRKCTRCAVWYSWWVPSRSKWWTSSSTPRSSLATTSTMSSWKVPPVRSMTPPIQAGNSSRL